MALPFPTGPAAQYDPIAQGAVTSANLASRSLPIRRSPTIAEGAVTSAKLASRAYSDAFPADSGGDSSPAPAPVDPYAQWGGQQQYNAYLDQYNSGLDNVRAGAGEAFTGAGSQLRGDASTVFNNFRVGQQGIDTSRANNELNRVNSIGDIVNYVRQGLRQGAARLANANATDSSATAALANAYSQVGNSKSRSVNNQSAIQTNTLDQNQRELNNQETNDVDAFHRTRDQLVNAIGADIRTKLAALDSTAAGLNLPGRVAVDQEKQKLIDEGMGKLQDVESWLQDQLGTVHPASQNDTIAQAQKLRALGTATPNPFNVGFEGQQVVPGPAIGQLPLFVRSRRETA